MKVVLGGLKEKAEELQTFLEPRVGVKPNVKAGELEMEDSAVRKGVKPRHVKTYVKRFLHQNGLRKTFRVLVSGSQLTIQELERKEEEEEEKIEKKVAQEKKEEAMAEEVKVEAAKMKEAKVEKEAPPVPEKKEAPKEKKKEAPEEKKKEKPKEKKSPEAKKKPSKKKS